MLPKPKRLSAKDGTIKGGVTFSTPYFLLKAKRTDGRENRFAIVLGVRVSKSSVARHYLKRRIADELATWPTFVPPGGATAGKPASARAYDMICIVSPRAALVPKEKVRQEFHAAFEKAKEFFEKTA